MDSIVTVDIGSTSMRAVHHDTAGRVLHKCRRITIPEYYEDKRVELDGRKFVRELLSLLKESYDFARSNKINVLALSVTSQRSSVVPVDSSGVPLAPFIMWHDKRTVPICRELAPHEDRVYQLTGLRISPVFSAVKMTWLRREMSDIYGRTAKLIGIHDIALHTLSGEFLTDESLASNTSLLNIYSREWDQELLDIFSVDEKHLCDLVPAGSVCASTTRELERLTGIPEHTRIISAGGDQQCAALGLGIMSESKLKCTTGTGSYLIAHTEAPVLDEQKRFLCKIGALPGSYNLEAGMLTTGTVYRWFLEQCYGDSSDLAIERINREILTSPPGANGVLLLPYFEGSGAPHWNPDDCGVFYRLKLSTTRADMARAVLEGIVMAMGENIAAFKQKLGSFSTVSVSGGMTTFAAYNQLQADIFGTDVVLHKNRESTSLGAWISAAVTCGIYDTYEQAFKTIQPPNSETVFKPVPDMVQFYQELNEKRTSLHRALQQFEASA